MTKKFWIGLGLAIVLIANIVMCGCMNISASMVPAVSYSETKVVLEGTIEAVYYRPHYSTINRCPTYTIYVKKGPSTYSLDIIVGGLDDGYMVVRSMDIKRQLADLVENPKTGCHCKVIAGKVVGTDDWEVTDIIISA
jgi:hypothetical protein